MQLLPKVGETFHERFEIVAELGSGGMGTVYLARQLPTKRRVALKILRLNNSQSQDDFDRFLREFRLLSGLSHHNIVTFYSAAITPAGVPYAVSEYLEGKSLSRLIIEEKQLPWSRMSHIASQICEGMYDAHRHSVIHRDLKPANIMLVETPESDTVKIIDFGLAKPLAQPQDKRLTKTGALVGSPHYMSPEQARGEKVDERSDIYSLGCIFFEALSGNKLFDADTAIGVVHKQVHENASEILRRSLPGLSRAQSIFFEKLLAKNPSDRFQNMQEVGQALACISGGESSALEQKLGPGNRNSKLLAALIGLIIFCLLPFALLQFGVGRSMFAGLDKRSASSISISEYKTGSKKTRLRAKPEITDFRSRLRSLIDAADIIAGEPSKKRQAIASLTRKNR